MVASSVSRWYFRKSTIRICNDVETLFWWQRKVSIRMNAVVCHRNLTYYKIRTIMWEQFASRKRHGETETSKGLVVFGHLRRVWYFGLLFLCSKPLNTLKKLRITYFRKRMSSFPLLIPVRRSLLYTYYEASIHLFLFTPNNDGRSPSLRWVKESFLVTTCNLLKCKSLESPARVNGLTWTLNPNNLRGHSRIFEAPPSMRMISHTKMINDDDIYITIFCGIIHYVVWGHSSLSNKPTVHIIPCTVKIRHQSET